MARINLDVNGKIHTIDADPDMPLLYALRNDLGLNNPHFGCGLAQCGACTVHVDGQPARSCVTPVSAVGGAKVVTLAGLGTPDKPRHRPHVAALDEVGNILSKWPELKIEIGGHTDSQGSNAFNQKLSEERAASVKTYLVEKFPTLRPDQITTVGYGESKPFVKNDTALNRAKNRRVEFTVLNTEELKRVKESIQTVPKK